MNTDIEISEYLQRVRKRTRDRTRPLVVTFGCGCYGAPSVAIVEVQGSPNKGMAVLRLASGSFADVDEGMDLSFCEVWVMQADGRMVSAPERGPIVRGFLALAVRRIQGT